MCRRKRVVDENFGQLVYGCDREGMKWISVRGSAFVMHHVFGTISPVAEHERARHKTYIVIRFLPVGHAGESLTNTHALDPMLENLDTSIRRELLACRIQVRFPELTSSHNETCEEERTRRANVFNGMEDGIEETNEWVQP